MKRALIGMGIAALVAAPAMAQGTFSPGAPKSTWNSGPSPKAPAPYKAPTPAPAPKPKTYGAPEAPKPAPFKPYKSNNGTSLFGPDGKPKR